MSQMIPSFPFFVFFTSLFFLCLALEEGDTSSSWKLLKNLNLEGSLGRQGWTSTYSTGGYDIYTLIAVAAFAALFGAIFYEIATRGTFRSLGSSFGGTWFGNLLDSDQLTELVSRVSDFLGEIDWDGVVRNATKMEESKMRKGRGIRDVGKEPSSPPPGLIQWMQAYKKDPVQFQCVRKLACKTLAESPLIARSMRSQFGGLFLSAVGMFMDSGEEVKRIVRDTVGNPHKCKGFAPWGFCDGEAKKAKTKTKN